MIQLENVTKYFEQNGICFPPVLSGLHLSVAQGEFLCVLGPSGCGKTTFLNLIAGFIRPSKGRVLFVQKEIKGPSPARGVVFQDATLFPWLTVLQNVGFGLRMKGMKGELLKKNTLKFLDMMGLHNHANKYPYALSGGMRQRVAIARVLALEPQVLLMDEPFSALDANTRERLQDELLRVWGLHKRTIIYITHSVEEATYLADRVVVFGEAQTGLVADLSISLKRPRRRDDRDFLILKDLLRSRLAEQPCCIQPQHIIGDRSV
jgi:NitT/TauT family transport system ATP-binding protein